MNLMVEHLLLFAEETQQYGNSATLVPGSACFAIVRRQKLPKSLPAVVNQIAL